MGLIQEDIRIYRRNIWGIVRATLGLGCRVHGFVQECRGFYEGL